MSADIQHGHSRAQQRFDKMQLLLFESFLDQFSIQLTAFR
jgi:hypothetical protein